MRQVDAGQTWFSLRIRIWRTHSLSNTIFITFASNSRDRTDRRQTICRLDLLQPMDQQQQWARSFHGYTPHLIPRLRPWHLTGERLSTDELWNVWGAAMAVFLVIRLEGMRLLRPARSWRPIVTVEIDEYNIHETILGIDGQNVNQKETFSLCVLIFFFFADAYLEPFFSFSSSVIK